jgi:hypothetical protein
MVAIYIPVLQSAEQVYLHFAKSFHLDYKIAFMLRALHACNKAKDHKMTCLGTAVTYHRRCRKPLRTTKMIAVLAEMVEAAEDPYALLGDLRFVAVDWAAGLSCYLHGAQKGVAMAALGAVAVYRLESQVVAVDPGRPGLWRYILDPVHRAEGYVSLQAKEKAAECLVENTGESDAVIERSLEMLVGLAKKVDGSNAVS